MPTLLIQGAPFIIGAIHDAMEALSGIVAGRDVPVYYDKCHPQRAVLRKG
jgi:hypothetical protein